MSSRHTQSDKQQIAAQLKNYRRGKKMTQEELARMLATSVFSVNRWETEKHHPNSSVIKLMRMLKVLR
ncbi:MAG: helix-turn-helix domain-containing protein [Candidatus Omnitrophota bacterium]